jgi:hypothetical protein
MLKSPLTSKWRAVLVAAALPALAACSPIAPEPAPTPTVDPDIYNQVPDTTVFEPGQCSVVLDAPAPTYTSNTLGGQPSGEIAAGTYAVGVAADYGSSLWYMLNVAGETPFINSASAASTEGDCSTGN